MKNKNNKDYLLRNIIIQFIFSGVLFVTVFGLYSMNQPWLNDIFTEYSKILESNISEDDVVDVFNEVENFIENIEETEESTDLIAYVKASNTIKSTNKTPENISLNQYELSQTMIKPTNGKITSPFGFRYHPISGEYSFHAGVDIASNENEPIYAAFDGEVIVSSYDQWNGNYLKIQHDNTIMTVYCHCNKLLVKKGSNVKAGQKIALMGSTGSSTGTHLHFELRFNNISFNPEFAMETNINAI